MQSASFMRVNLKFADVVEKHGAWGERCRLLVRRFHHNYLVPAARQIVSVAFVLLWYLFWVMNEKTGIKDRKHNTLVARQHMGITHENQKPFIRHIPWRSGHPVIMLPSTDEMNPWLGKFRTCSRHRLLPPLFRCSPTAYLPSPAFHGNWQMTSCVLHCLRSLPAEIARHTPPKCMEVVQYHCHRLSKNVL